MNNNFAYFVAINYLSSHCYVGQTKEFSKRLFFQKKQKKKTTAWGITCKVNSKMGLGVQPLFDNNYDHMG